MSNASLLKKSGDPDDFIRFLNIFTCGYVLFASLFYSSQADGDFSLQHQLPLPLSAFQLKDTLQNMKVEIIQYETEADIAIACSDQNAGCAPGEELCFCVGHDR